MRRKRNQPYKITTAGTWGRRIASTFLLIIVIIIVWLILSVMSGALPSPIELVSGVLEDTTDQTEQEEVTVPDTTQDDVETQQSNDTAKDATDTLNAYYDAITSNNTSRLHEIGADATASAIERGWLQRIDYQVTSTSQASADSFPSSVGTYAGNTLYSISDFYQDSENAIHSSVTGDTPREGWVYYDTMTNGWVIVDPTIPTATQTPKSSTVRLTSADRSTTVSITTQGALSNPWWSCLDESVEVTTSGTVTMTKRQFDGGVTMTVPSNLTGTQGSQSGTIRIVRGNTSSFGTEKIGQEPLILDGDMAGITVTSGTQDVTPSLTIGTDGE